MKKRRPVIQLTALLDLLFIMVFVSLNKTHVEVTATPQMPLKEHGEVTPQKKATPVSKPIPIKKEIPLSAVFSFYPTPENPNVPRGSFEMKGVLKTESKRFQLGGTAWIIRPPNFEMISLSGTASTEEGVLRGKIEFDGCSDFVIRREPNRQPDKIEGMWIGTYACLQGKTGFTLQIFED